ncbi:MAG: hypothetical protein VX454_11080 [Pseudomonadota bacterium]|nr:hypothetical protein [Pseudomonadota bacterium]
MDDVEAIDRVRIRVTPGAEKQGVHTPRTSLPCRFLLAELRKEIGAEGLREGVSPAKSKVFTADFQTQY